MWIPIKYSEYWDVPRVFLVRHKGRLLLLTSHFDDELDDYSPNYKVFLMPAITDAELEAGYGSKWSEKWKEVEACVESFLGEVPVKSIRFDPTHRREIDSEILESIQ